MWSLTWAPILVLEKGTPAKKTRKILAQFLNHGKSWKGSAWNQPHAKKDMLGFNQILEDRQMVEAKLSILAMKSDKSVRIEPELRQRTLVFCVVFIDAHFKWRNERKCAGIVSFFSYITYYGVWNPRYVCFLASRPFLLKCHTVCLFLALVQRLWKTFK